MRMRMRILVVTIVNVKDNIEVDFLTNASKSNNKCDSWVIHIIRTTCIHIDIICIRIICITLISSLPVSSVGGYLDKYQQLGVKSDNKCDRRVIR